MLFPDPSSQGTVSPDGKATYTTGVYPEKHLPEPGVGHALRTSQKSDPRQTVAEPCLCTYAASAGQAPKLRNLYYKRVPGFLLSWILYSTSSIELVVNSLVAVNEAVETFVIQKVISTLTARSFSRTRLSAQLRHASSTWLLVLG